MTNMIIERDVWRAAKLLIEQHGVESPIEAAMRADEMLNKGDLDGQAVWKAILKAVIELMNKEPEGTCIDGAQCPLLANMTRPKARLRAKAKAAQKAKKREAIAEFRFYPLTILFFVCMPLSWYAAWITPGSGFLVVGVSLIFPTYGLAYWTLATLFGSGFLASTGAYILGFLGFIVAGTLAGFLIDPQ